MEACNNLKTRPQLRGHEIQGNEMEYINQYCIELQGPCRIKCTNKNHVLPFVIFMIIAPILPAVCLLIKRYNPKY